jgi:endothelin-converting enzyme
VKAYNAYNLTQLRTDAPYINWPDYFSGFAPRIVPSPLIVSTPSYFINLTSILEETDDSTLEAYFVWTAVKSLSKLLGPRETARKEVTQLSNYLSGIEEGVRGRREDVCLQSLLDNYGFMIGRYYVKQAFSGMSTVSRGSEEVLRK